MEFKGHSSVIIMWLLHYNSSTLTSLTSHLSNFLMSAYFCPHSVFNSGYLIEFVCLKSELIDNYDN